MHAAAAGRDAAGVRGRSRAQPSCMAWVFETAQDADAAAEQKLCWYPVRQASCQLYGAAQLGTMPRNELVAHSNCATGGLPPPAAYLVADPIRQAPGVDRETVAFRLHVDDQDQAWFVSRHHRRRANNARLQGMPVATERDASVAVALRHVGTEQRPDASREDLLAGPCTASCSRRAPRSGPGPWAVRRAPTRRARRRARRRVQRADSAGACATPPRGRGAAPAPGGTVLWSGVLGAAAAAPPAFDDSWSIVSATFATLYGQADFADVVPGDVCSSEMPSGVRLVRLADASFPGRATPMAQASVFAQDVANNPLALRRVDATQARARSCCSAPPSPCSTRRSWGRARASSWASEPTGAPSTDPCWTRSGGPARSHGGCRTPCRARCRGGPASSPASSATRSRATRTRRRACTPRRAPTRSASARTCTTPAPS